MFSNSLVAVTFVSTISTLSWWGLYKKLKSNYKWEPEFASRLVAALHAIIVVALAFYCIKNGSDPLKSPGEPNTTAQIVTMYISVGYFIYDFFWCLKHQPEPKIMLFHHLASFFAILYILSVGKSGSEAIGGLGSLELTNPLLQGRWFLRTLGYSHTLLYKIVEISFFLLFLIIRIGYGTLLLISVVGSDKCAFPVKACTVLLYIISLAFIYLIGRFVAKKMDRKNSKRDGNAGDDDDDDVKLS